MSMALVVHPLFAPKQREAEAKAQLQSQKQQSRQKKSRVDWGSLPTELWHHVAKQQDDGRDLARLSCVCLGARPLSHDSELWRRLCILQYGDWKYGDWQYGDWKELFVFNHSLLRDVLLSPTLASAMSQAYPRITSFTL